LRIARRADRQKTLTTLTFVTGGFATSATIPVSHRNRKADNFKDLERVWNEPRPNR
jgi:hypothetical protein